MNTHRFSGLTSLRGRSGFTLIETLVAVTILVLAVAGPLTVASRVLIAAQNSKDQLIASYLAQEGIEYVRAMRDHEFLRAHTGSDASQVAWQAFANGVSNNGSIASCRTSGANPNQACALDSFSPMGHGNGNSLRPCGVSLCGPLYITSVGQYRLGASGNTLTPYTRTIQATLLPSSTDMQIASTVRWVSRGTTYSVTVTDNLTPWQ